MQTNFTLDQLSDSKIKVANDILRKCVHCGFCIATCPTYILKGDELDSPRGRIYLIKHMLESNTPPTKKVVTHIDRCLSCLSCMSTCPASVNYMHLIDNTRTYIEDTYKRPIGDFLFRKVLAFILPYPKRFRFSLYCARLVKPLAIFFPKKLYNLILATPSGRLSPSTVDKPQVFSALGKKRKRVALLSGCAQQILQPTINEATVRLLSRHGCEVVIAEGSKCCGALAHHLGQEKKAIEAAKANIIAWETAGDAQSLDAIVINTSGCGTTIKDYGFLLREDPKWAKRAAKISSMTRDITEIITEIGLKNLTKTKKPNIVYHSACSMQHGQQIHYQPQKLLTDAGFQVSEPNESHICCGSAGTYSFLQPEIAQELQMRKVKHLVATGAPLVATGNIGCIMHIKQEIDKTYKIPVIHTVELLDWATGGPKPKSLG